MRLEAYRAKLSEFKTRLDIDDNLYWMQEDYWLELIEAHEVALQALLTVRHHVVGFKGNGEILTEIDETLKQITGES